nr:uncharacterized protein LOC118683410 [Bactrocera oleae]
MKIAELNGNKFEAFIDTGSVCSLIRETAANGMQTQEANRCFMGFGGSKVKVTHQVNVVATIDNVKHEVTLYLVQDELLPYDILVGRDVLQSNGYQMHVRFLGHDIDSKGIRPGEIKTKVIKEFPKPTTTKAVRQFLGITGYFRKFVKGYRILAQPLTLLLKKNAEFVWNEEQNDAFEKLKSLITTKPVLTIYDATKAHEVHTDASSAVLSGVLMQNDEESEWKPVFYFSRQCNDAERNYASHELEVLAIVETLQRYRMYLIGHRFKVITDCNAVAVTKATTPLLPRVARWWLKLQEFDFQCVHRAGTKNTLADGLSRCPTLPPVESTTIAESIYPMVKIDNDWVSQRQNETLKEIIEVLNGKETFNAPQLKDDYIWQECCINEASGGKKEAQLHVSEVVPISFRCIHVDHLGPFIRSKHGNVYILVIVCAFTKYVILKALRNTKTTPVVSTLRDYITIYGCPKQIVSDRGTAFTSKEYQSFTDRYDIKQVKVAVRTPRANGQAEHVNKTVLASLKYSIKADKEWDEALPQLQWSINSQSNATTKQSPNSLVFNYKPRDVTTNRLIQAITDDDDDGKTQHEDFRLKSAAKRINIERAK